MEIINYLKQRNITINNIDLLKEALTHHSYINEHKDIKNDYQRLEFLGDAVLQIWVAKKLYLLQPSIDEGQMSVLRSQLVDTNACSKYAKIMHLNDDIFLGTGEEKNGGRDREHILEDVFEATLGAIYLDQGKEAIDIILEELITPYITNQEKIQEKNYKSILQEFIQSDNRNTPVYVLMGKTGPDNSPVFEIHVKIDNVVYGVGFGPNKKKAEQLAAKDALNKLKVD